MNSNRRRVWIAGAWTLGVLGFAGCGPGVGGTGTGAAALDAFGARATSVCEATIAAELACPQPPVGAGAGALGTQPVRFVDGAGQVTLEIDGNLATLDAACPRLRFHGEFGIGNANVEGFFGSYEVEGTGTNVLSALSTVRLTGGGVSIELRDVLGRVILNAVVLQRATTVPPAPAPC